MLIRAVLKKCCMVAGLLSVPFAAFGMTMDANSIPGGWVRRVVSAPGAAQTMYAASWGVYKSVDGGMTWESKPYPLPVFDPGDASHFPRHNTLSIAIDPSNENTVITGDQNETPIWRTTDGGDTWTSVLLENDTEGRMVNAVSFSLTDTNTVFAAGRINPNVGDVRNVYLYMSSDKGQTWTKKPTVTGNSSQSILDILQAPLVGPQGLIVVGLIDSYYDPSGNGTVPGTGKIFYSTDNGGTFQSVTVPWAPYQFTWDPVNATIWAISSQGKVYSSTNGSTWTDSGWTGASAAIGSPVGSALMGRNRIIFANPPSLYVCVQGNSNSSRRVFSNTNAGAGFPAASWQEIVVAPYGGSEVLGGIYDIAVDFTGGGNSWGLATTNGGYYFTTDNGTTLTQSPGINTREVRYGVKAGSRMFANAFDNLIYASTDTGTSWTRVYPESGGGAGGGFVYIAVDPVNDENVYLSVGSTVLISTANGSGGFKSAIDLGGQAFMPPAGAGIGQLTNILIRPSTPTVMYVGYAQKNTAASGYYLYKSTNAALSWSPVTTLTSHGINLLAMDPSNPDVIYAHCGTGWGSRPFNGTGEGLYKSTDSAATWTKLGEGILDSGYLETMAFDPLDTNTIFAAGVYSGSSNGVTDQVHISTDGGTVWKTLLISGHQINTSKVFYYGSSLYTGNSEGFLYKSDDKGMNWGIAALLPATISWVFDDSTGTVSGAPVRRAPGTSSIYAGSNAGLFHVTGMGAASGISGGYGNPVPPGSGGTTLKTYNFPNPFNPKSGGTTTIRLNLLSAAASLKVKIFSLSGELIFEQSFENVAAGGSGFDWDGRNKGGILCAPGLYFLVADADGTKAQHKIVLVY